MPPKKLPTLKPPDAGWGGAGVVVVVLGDGVGTAVVVSGAPVVVGAAVEVVVGAGVVVSGAGVVVVSGAGVVVVSGAVVVVVSGAGVVVVSGAGVVVVSFEVVVVALGASVVVEVVVVKAEQSVTTVQVSATPTAGIHTGPEPSLSQEAKAQFSTL